MKFGRSTPTATTSRYCGALRTALLHTVLVCCSLSPVSEAGAQQQVWSGKYAGPPLEAHQIAQLFHHLDGNLYSLLLREGAGVLIRKIDGQKPEQSTSVIRVRSPGPYEFVPGRHTIELTLNPLRAHVMGGTVEATPIELTFDSKPGGKYVVDGEAERIFAPGQKGKWFASIVDLETGENVAGVQTYGYVPKTKYESEEFAPFKQKGRGVISGTVQQTSPPDYSENYVLLVPDTPLTEELIQHGLVNGERMRALSFYDIPSWRSGPAPSQNFIRFAQKPLSFTFKNLPEGKYFVLNRTIRSPRDGKEVVGIAIARVTLARDAEMSDVICSTVPESVAR